MDKLGSESKSDCLCTLLGVTILSPDSLLLGKQQKVWMKMVYWEIQATGELFLEVGPETLDLVIFFFFLREVKNLDFLCRMFKFKILALYSRWIVCLLDVAWECQFVTFAYCIAFSRFCSEVFLLTLYNWKLLRVCETVLIE